MLVCVVVGWVGGSVEGLGLQSGLQSGLWMRVGVLVGLGWRVGGCDGRRWMVVDVFLARARGARRARARSELTDLRSRRPAAGRWGRRCVCVWFYFFLVFVFFVVLVHVSCVSCVFRACVVRVSCVCRAV